VLGQDQRGFQVEVLDPVAAGVVAGAQRKLDEGRAG
jgi:hypothetical protein